MSLFTQRVYVMQSKTLSDMTNNVLIEYLKKFLYSSVDQVVELCEQFFFFGTPCILGAPISDKCAWQRLSGSSGDDEP